MKKTVIVCDECGKEWPENGEAKYEQGTVEVANASVYLPSRIATDGNHTRSLNGTYCSYRCLMRRIRGYLRLDDAAPDALIDSAPPSEPPTGRKIIVKEPGAAQ